MVGASSRMCEKFGREPGRPFKFLYGTVDTQTEQAGGFSRTTSREWIVGEETAVVCDRCIREYQRRGVVNGWVAAVVSVVLIAIGVALFLSGPLEGEVEMQPQQLLGFFLAIGGCLGVVLSLLWVRHHRGPLSTVLGEEVALRLRRKALEKRGFDGTWTHEGWQNHLRSVRGG